MKELEKKTAREGEEGRGSCIKGMIPKKDRRRRYVKENRGSRAQEEMTSLCK